MIRSVKASLDYFTRNFSRYQHRQLRIIEFPRYQMFAQSFPNTIPYSEGLGFIAKVDPKDDKGFEALSFTGRAVLNFRFMPVTIQGKTRYVPIRIS